MELKNLIASGETVDVYQDGKYAVKVFKSKSAKEKALYEALIHARVETTGLPMPVIREVSVIDEKWAIRMDLIEGRTLYEVMKNDTEHLEEYIDAMVNLQLEIHSKTVPMLDSLTEELSEQIKALTCIDNSKKYELLSRLESMPKHRKLCHGNFTPMNIIINENDTYIVDWVAAKQGNASADAARTYHMLALDFPQAAELYLDSFCRKTGTEKFYVQLWLPIVAAARLDCGNPGDKELLSQWIDIIEYQ